MPRSRRRRSGRRRRRALRLTGVGALVLLAAVAWGGWNATQGAIDLQTARSQLAALQSDLPQQPDLLPRLQSVAERTAGARGHLNDPVLRAAAVLPVIGRPFDTAGGVADSVDVAVRAALLPLVRSAGGNPVEQLTSGPGAVNLDYLQRLAAPAAAADKSLTQATAVLDATPASTGVDRLDQARTELGEELGRLQSAVGNLALASDIGPDLLGAQGERRYLVVSQSPAEARGTGGLIGGYTLLQADQGALTILRSGPRSELQSPGEPVVDLGPEFDEHYGHNGATSGWINSNLSPHFPYAAKIWQELWQRQYGEQLDGAVIVDPIALSYLLEATGPLPLADGSTITAGNVVDLTLRDVYGRFDEDPARDAYLQEVSGAVTSALVSRELPGRPLVEGLARAVRERRLLLWSADETMQQRLADLPISGTLPANRPAIGDVIVDSAGSKLDYYLERSLKYRPGCGGLSTLTLTLTNSAPAQGLPEYVTPPQFRNGLPPGSNRMLVTLYVPPKSSNIALKASDKATAPRTGTELGLVWVEQLVELRPGKSVELTLRFLEPGRAAAVPERIVQPLVRPEIFTAVGC